MTSICRETGGSFWDCLPSEMQSFPIYAHFLILGGLVVVFIICFGLVRKFEKYSLPSLFFFFLTMVSSILFGVYIIIGFIIYDNPQHQSDVYGYDVGAFDTSKEVVDETNDIDYIHQYIKEHEETDDNIHKETYTLNYEDFKRDVKEETLDIEVKGTKHGLTPVHLRADNGSVLEHTVYPEIICSDREDVELTGYHVKSDVMTGFPEGFYDATLDIPEDMGVCEAIHQEKNIFEPN